MGFFADGRDEAEEEKEARELDGQFVATSVASRTYMRVTRWVPKLIKWFLLLCILLTYGLFFVRVQYGKAPKTMREFVFSADAVYAYATRPADFKVYAQKQEANLQSVKVDNTYSLTIQTTHILYAPTAGQIQFVVRYNESMKKTLNVIEGKDPFAERPGEYFSFALRDEKGNLYQNATLLAGQQRHVNLFRQICFTDVLFDVDTELTLLVSTAQNPDFQEPLLEMSLYRAVMQSTEEEFTCPDGLCLYMP